MSSMNANQQKWNDMSKAKSLKRKLRVRAWREAGWTWDKIGKKLGVTRQRALQIGNKPL